VFSGLVHCMEICARIFIPFCYWNSANIVNLATSRVWGRLQGSLETTNSDLLELLDDADKYKKIDVQKSGTAYSLYIYTRTHILIRKSRMSLFNVFCFIQSV